DADHQRRYRHRSHGKGERDLAAEFVADVPYHATAQWPHHVAHGEDAEGGKDLSHFILGGKERAADLGGEVAVDGKIVPFEHVADDAGRDVASRACGCGRHVDDTVRDPISLWKGSAVSIKAIKVTAAAPATSHA